MDHKQKVNAKYSKSRNFTPLNADSTDFQFSFSSACCVYRLLFKQSYGRNVILRIFFSDPKKVFFNVSLAL